VDDSSQQPFLVKYNFVHGRIEERERSQVQSFQEEWQAKVQAEEVQVKVQTKVQTKVQESLFEGKEMKKILGGSHLLLLLCNAI
jgi:hypothetical protein